MHTCVVRCVPHASCGARQPSAREVLRMNDGGHVLLDYCWADSRAQATADCHRPECLAYRSLLSPQRHAKL